MERGGFELPSQACYIHCSSACGDWAASRDPGYAAEHEMDEENDGASDALGTVMQSDLIDPIAMPSESITSATCVSTDSGGIEKRDFDVKGSEEKIDSTNYKPNELSAAEQSKLIDRTSKDIGPHQSLESLLTTMDDPSAKEALDEFTILKNNLPVYFSWNRCLKCFTFHEAGRCFNHFLEYNVFETAEDENDINQVKRKFLSEMVYTFKLRFEKLNEFL